MHHQSEQISGLIKQVSAIDNESEYVRQYLPRLIPIRLNPTIGINSDDFTRISLKNIIPVMPYVNMPHSPTAFHAITECMDFTYGIVDNTSN